jgi:hypothetical protein
LGLLLHMYLPLNMYEIRQILSHTSAVLEFLLQQSTNDGLDKHSRRIKVLRCLLSWVRVALVLKKFNNLV